MKNPIPLKRHKALVSFSRDHHFGLLLVWKIRQGLNHVVEPERISNYLLHFFEQDLQQHFKEEEQLIFCKLPVDNILRQQAEREHQIIYELVERIRQDRRNEKLLMKFADALQAHIRFEERTLFGYMQQVLSQAEWEVISGYEGGQAEEVDSGWEDVFWGNK